MSSTSNMWAYCHDLYLHCAADVINGQVELSLVDHWLVRLLLSDNASALEGIALGLGTTGR